MIFVLSPVFSVILDEC